MPIQTYKPKCKCKNPDIEGSELAWEERMAGVPEAQWDIYCDQKHIIIHGNPPDDEDPESTAWNNFARKMSKYYG